ncbi:MAG: long-chain-acyl-CoA synthetase [Caulobacteraceae bacterium]
MGIWARLGRDLRFLVGLTRTLARVASISADSGRLVTDDLERAADRFARRPAIRFEGRSLAHGELDALANRYANWALAEGMKRGEAVAVVLPNRLDYLAIWHGLAKVGVAAALVNFELAGEVLAHCLDVSGATRCVVDETTAAAFAAARSLVDRPMVAWTLGPAAADERDLASAIAGASEARPPRSVRAGMTARDTALFIYTSGTTGPPKAARIAHMRAQLYMRGFAGATGARPRDRIHVSLPLYHATGGLCAMGAALLNGGCVILRRQFSATGFWAEIAAERATMFVYIGELCRYLAAQPVRSEEKRHKVRLAFGNGLNPTIWREMEGRFGVRKILEFYGSTEGNVSMFNFDGALGAVGRAPRWLAPVFNLALVRYDVTAEAPARGPGGFCIRAGFDEAGECLGRIGAGARSAYAGYADPAASRGKVLERVFAPGDRWFATGDLLRQDAEGYFYFVDRVGDTYRWKGQNVSTSEVAERLGAAPSVKEASVYGVKVGALEGRAGMAALVVGPGFDLGAFASIVDHSLPSYARPIFLRIDPRIEMTGTFKHKKAELVAEGFDPAKVRGELYFRGQAGGYARLTPALYEIVVSGAARL